MGIIIFCISMMVFAIHYTMQEGEIFGFVGKWLHDWLPPKYHQPVFECPVCMAPWYGTLIYWIFWHQGKKEWIICIIAAMGLNAVLMKLFPDKETPGVHQELGDIAGGITDIGQILTAINDRKPGPKFQPKKNGK